MSASIVGILFGVEVDVSGNEWYVKIAEDILDGIAEAGVPGAFLVDIIPIRESREKHTICATGHPHSCKFLQLNMFLGGFLSLVFRRKLAITDSSCQSSATVHWRL
jgi:hypothetical protein